jgi:hypothetical protein
MRDLDKTRTRIGTLLYCGARLTRVGKVSEVDHTTVAALNSQELSNADPEDSG